MRILTPCFMFLVWLLLSGQATSQNSQNYDLGGASKPKPQLSFGNGKQYKRIHQTALWFILAGEKLDATENFLNQFLIDNPKDAETLYMLGVLYGQTGQLELAEEHLQQALQAGLPEDRLIAGPREVFRPLAETRLIKQLFEKYKHNLVHGPLLGNATDSSASFWVRTANKAEVQVVVSDAQGQEVCRSEKTVSKIADDSTAVATATGLKPATKYRYTVLVNGKACDKTGVKSFQTFPSNNKPAKFKIAFGGGAGYVPPNEKMWNTIGEFDPAAILLLGDNVYIDDPESQVMQQYTYHRRQSRPEWRNLTSSTPVFTIWDDHDFSTNDSWGGADIAIPFWKKEIVFPVFRQNWANPGYAGGNDQPGCWYSFRIGDVDFIMLDCRYYRTRPRDNPRSMLGPAQKKWLKAQLLQAKGTFKVLCSSVPWDYRTKGGSRDTWNGYKEERDEIFGFIDEHELEGIVLISADRHRSDAWKIQRAGGYDFYEFNSSRLTNQHVHPTMEKKGAIFSYNKLQSFGLVTFDTTVDDPTVQYEVVNINGEKMHSLEVKRRELTFGKRK